MPGFKREQGADVEGVVNTRQDRNLSITDGGTLTWNAGTGVLTWSATMYLHVPGFTPISIATGSRNGIVLADSCVVVNLNRSAGTVGAVGTRLIQDELGEDEDLVLATRGTDGKLYFRNGTIFTDGDSKPFGTLNSATDRTEVIANGNALQAVGFTYLTASNQLAVYVGGILQKLGLHYTETSSTQVTFATDFIPSTGELITFLNVVGGEGPPGDGDLQGAYDSGPTIDVVDGTPAALTSDTGDSSTVLLQGGHSSEAGGESAFQVTREGELTVNRILIRDLATGTKIWALEVDPNGNLRLRNTTSSQEHGIQINDDGTGIEFGVFASLGSTGVTGGSTEISHFTGTTSAVSATTVTTSISSIKGVLVSVFNAATSRYQVYGFADTATAAREFYVTWTAAGVVTLSSASNGTGVLPANLQGQTYKVVVFH